MDEDGVEIDDEVKEYPHLLRLWTLADMLLIPKLQNHTMKKLEEILQQTSHFCFPSFHYIYSSTSKDSVLRKWVVIKYLNEHGEGGGFATRCCKNWFPRTMLFDMLEITMHKDTANIYDADYIPVEEFYVPEDDD